VDGDPFAVLELFGRDGILRYTIGRKSELSYEIFLALAEFIFELCPANSSIRGAADVRLDEQ
jgi:hypothetical protein